MVISMLLKRCIDRLMRKTLNEEVIKDMMADASLMSELEGEWEQLKEDRTSIRQVFPTGDTRIVLPCNMNRILWNAQKVFRINKRKPSDLHPLRVIDGKSGNFFST